jgi:hypothetical protein
MAIVSGYAIGRTAMKPVSSASMAFVALSLWAVGYFADIADLVRDRSGVSSSETAASTITPSVKRVAVRIQVHDPALPASYLDGVRIMHTASPSSRPEATDDRAERERDRSVSPTDWLGEPRAVRTVVVKRDETAPPSGTAPIRGDAAQGEARRSGSDAQAILREMRVEYGPVAGQPEMISRTGADGTVLYYVRVGPFARDDAARLCNALRESGGPCPTARE